MVIRILLIFGSILGLICSTGYADPVSDIQAKLEAQAKARQEQKEKDQRDSKEIQDLIRIEQTKADKAAKDAEKRYLADQKILSENIKSLEQLIRSVGKDEAAEDPEPTPQVEPQISLPQNLTGEESQYIAVRATTNGKRVQWYAVTKGLQVFPSEMLIDSRSTVVSAAKPGKYRLMAYTALGDKPSVAADCVIVVGSGEAPDVDPDPVDPKPIPSPKGFRVIIYVPDQPDRKLSNIYMSEKVRAFLDANCAKGTDGTPEWRVWTPNTIILGKESPTMVELFNQAKVKAASPFKPQILIANDQGGEWFSLPSDIDSFVKLLETKLPKKAVK